ncbi:MAG: phospholipase D-like domain-containing protein [Sulfurospirillaceae bacterium]|nr:phospholipase D-like domain-containing protein [Sulfurospirillaceae bacterium]
MDLDITHIILYHSLIVFGEILIMFTFIHMIYRRRSSASMIAWLLFIILVPYIAVVLYFIFGFRKHKKSYTKTNMHLKKHKYEHKTLNPISEILRNYNIADTCNNEYFKLYSDPIKAYEIFIECIKSAKESIFLSTYVFKYDEITKIIIDELIKKANEGVTIKILVDTLGSWKLYFSTYHLREMKKAGIQIHFFMPIFQMPFRNYINLRNHRKIYIFDNKQVISGGINISREYFGPNIDKLRWKDMLFLVKGRSAELFFEIFASDWFYASGEKLEFKNTPINSEGNTSIQIVPSGPDMEKDVLYEALLCAIYSAKKRIWIVTPYFVPDTSILQALIIAKHKGVDIKLITPKESNHFVVDLARNSYIHELEEAGIEVAMHSGVMIHAKAILFDYESVMLGSVNLDNRSLFLNYEIATFVYSKDVLKDIEKWMSELLADSSRDVKEISYAMKIVENLMRIVAPQL